MANIIICPQDTDTAGNNPKGGAVFIEGQDIPPLISPPTRADD